MRKLRLLHLWIGIVACVFIVILAATGIVLDHRDDLKIRGKVQTDNGLVIAKGFQPEDLPISPSQAIEIALKDFGDDVLFHKVELKESGNGLVYKLETTSRDKLYIDPVTGVVQRETSGSSRLVKISKMLHTGDGLINFPWLYDLIALSMIFLAVSGTTLYVRRLLR